MRLNDKSGLGLAIGGACVLIVAMGIGRFAFTAVLPGMMEVYGFDESVAGNMAAWNYAGYLAGVMLVRGVKGKLRYTYLFALLLVSLVTTAFMSLTTFPLLLYLIRFIAGVASGACFVLCSSIVLDALTALNQPRLAGLFYSGVGIGIVLSGLATSPLVASGGIHAAWLGFAALSLPLIITSLILLRHRHSESPPPVMDQSIHQKRSGVRSAYCLLLAAYFLEGLGYIIGATFIVTVVQITTNSPNVAQASWIVTGCAAALSTPLWRLAARKSYIPMLILAFILQGIGALLPVVSDSPLAALGGGVLLGGTFMGITVLSLQYGVQISGKPSANTIGLMTALYGIGQIIGPIIAGGRGFITAFLIASVCLFIGAALLTIAHFKNLNER